MKQRLMHAFGILMAALLTVCASTAGAATTATGSYYANPSWDQQIPAATRFIVLSNWVDANFPAGGAAVLDRETGLVWEISPSTSKFGWRDAQSHCNGAGVIDPITSAFLPGAKAGNRLGWRLPTIQELASLVDPTAPTAPGDLSLPAGHPFMNVIAGELYWSATLSAADAAAGIAVAWGMDFRFGGPLKESLGTGFNAGPSYVWCVRGGQGVDAQ